MRVDRLTPLFYIPTSWARPHVYTHTPKWASRGAALLRLPERAEQLVGLLWRGGPDAAGLTPRRHSSWNTPGLSVQTFFNLICIRPSLDPNRFGGRMAKGSWTKKTTAYGPVHHPLCTSNICIPADKEIKITFVFGNWAGVVKLSSPWLPWNKELKSFGLHRKQCVVIVIYQSCLGVHGCASMYFSKPNIAWLCVCSDSDFTSLCLWLIILFISCYSPPPD